MPGLIEQHAALYTDLDIAYNDAMSGPYRHMTVDMHSSGGDGIIVAGLKDGKITGLYRPMVAFGSDEFQRSEIERLWEISQDIFYQDFLIGSNLSPISRFLLERGHVATPYYTQVIDLSKRVEELRRGLRKSYHSLVNKDDNVEFCGIETFQGIHEYIKKKQRPQRTWDIQKQMQPICCHDNGRCAVMFYEGPVWAYYASAAGDNTHACIWACLMELKRRGVHYCEMGEQILVGNPKAVNISTYKKGFGGETRVRLNLRKATT